MKFLIIYFIIGLIASMILYIAERRGLLDELGDNGHFYLRDHIILILLWPVVIVITVINLFNSADDYDDDDTAGSY